MKNMRSIIAVMSAAVLAVPFCGCSDGKESTGGANVVYYDSQNSYVDSAEVLDSAEKEARDSAKIVKGGLDEKVTVGGCDSTIKKVVYIDTLDPDDRYPEPRNLYAALVEITNNTKDTITVSSLGNFSVSVDGGDKELGLDTVTSIIARRAIEDFEDLNYDAEPGQTVKGYVTFTTPEEWKEAVFEFTPRSGENVYDSSQYTITPDMVVED